MTKAEKKITNIAPKQHICNNLNDLIYSRQTDTAYITNLSTIDKAEYTVEGDGNFLMDFNCDDELIGIEIFFWSERDKITAVGDKKFNNNIVRLILLNHYIDRYELDIRLGKEHDINGHWTVQI